MPKNLFKTRRLLEITRIVCMEKNYNPISSKTERYNPLVFQILMPMSKRVSLYIYIYIYIYITTYMYSVIALCTCCCVVIAINNY